MYPQYITVYETWLEGALNVAQQEYPMMLSVSEAQKHLRDGLFHGLCKQLHDSMCYLYDDMRIMYPQLMTAAPKAESEQEHWPREEACMTLVQAEGRGCQCESERANHANHEIKQDNQQM